MLRGRPGFLHLVWADGLSWNKGREIVRHVRLARATGEWTETPPLRSHGRLIWLRAAVDTCGTLHLSYIDWSEGPDPHGRLAYARWTDRWVGPLHPFPEFAAWNDALAGTGSELSLVLPGRFLESGKEPTDRSWTTVMSSLSVQGEPD